VISAILVGLTSPSGEAALTAKSVVEHENLRAETK
jgi:hypothetical protein